MTLRRKAPPPTAPPGALERFSPGDWQGANMADRLDKWRAARRAWAAMHPGSLGDGLDQLITERAERQRVARIRAYERQDDL